MNGNSDLITLVKIEDKAFCNQLKDKLNYKYKVYLYNSDTKEVMIDEDGKFMIPNNDEEVKDSFIVISTSCIQAGQSLKEDNLISLFIQTPLDVISNVQQFIGRNRQPKSQTHLYLHFPSKQSVPLKYEHGSNRYKSKFNKMRTIAWSHTSVDKWKDVLIKYGKVIDETKKEVPPAKAQEEKEFVIDGKEYTTKKALYKHYGIKSLRYIPDGYTVSERWTNKNGNKTRLYKLSLCA